MFVLAIDTSTPDLIVGIVDSETGISIAERILTDSRAHNEQLTPLVQSALIDANLEFKDLNAIVVGCGPGPFTGLRVGMVSAAAFGDALGIPVHGVCSLDAIARGIDFKQYPIALVATDARRREVYWAQYENGQRTIGPEVNAPESLRLGNGLDLISIPEHLATKLPAELTGVDKQDLSPTAAHLVALAHLNEKPAPLVPLYLRRPDAKEPKPKPKSAAIPSVVLDD